MNWAILYIYTKIYREEKAASLAIAMTLRRRLPRCAPPMTVGRRLAIYKDFSNARTMGGHPASSPTPTLSQWRLHFPPLRLIPVVLGIFAKDSCRGIDSLFPNNSSMLPAFSPTSHILPMPTIGPSVLIWACTAPYRVSFPSLSSSS